MKILVTGGTGFIGSHIISQLKKQGYTVHLLVRPSTDTSQLVLKHIAYYEFNGDIGWLIGHLESEKYDGVVHLASLFLAQHDSSDIAELINSNILFSTQLLEAASKSHINWFINTGTFWQHYQNKDYAPVNLYAATKQAFEDLAQFYWQTNQINFITIKLSDTFGPGDTRQKLFNLWLNSAQNNEVLEMSPGEQLIDISYIDNVVDAYLQAIKLLSSSNSNEMKGKSYVVTSETRVQLKQLAIIFEKILGKKLQIRWGAKQYRLREVMVPWNKGEVVPGWKPRVSLEEGIRRFLVSAKID